MLEGRSPSEVRNPASPEANGIKILRRTRDNFKSGFEEIDSGLWRL
jgi:hypothetical protein